jgi:hypothetical protein
LDQNRGQFAQGGYFPAGDRSVAQFVSAWSSIAFHVSRLIADIAGTFVRLVAAIAIRASTSVAVGVRLLSPPAPLTTASLPVPLGLMLVWLAEQAARPRALRPLAVVVCHPSRSSGRARFAIPQPPSPSGQRRVMPDPWCRLRAACCWADGARGSSPVLRLPRRSFAGIDGLCGPFAGSRALTLAPVGYRLRFTPRFHSMSVACQLCSCSLLSSSRRCLESASSWVCSCPTCTCRTVRISERL